MALSSSFNKEKEEELCKQLVKRSASQDSIKAVFKWCMRYKNYASQIVQIWHQTLLQQPHETIRLLYLANHIVQHGNTNVFLPYFWAVFGAAFLQLATVAPAADVKVLRRLLHIWQDRSIFAAFHAGDTRPLHEILQLPQVSLDDERLSCFDGRVQVSVKCNHDGSTSVRVPDGSDLHRLALVGSKIQPLALQLSLQLVPSTDAAKTLAQIQRSSETDIDLDRQEELLLRHLCLCEQLQQQRTQFRGVVNDMAGKAQEAMKDVSALVELLKQGIEAADKIIAKENESHTTTQVSSASSSKVVASVFPDPPPLPPGDSPPPATASSSASSWYESTRPPPVPPLAPPHQQSMFASPLPPSRGRRER